MALVGNIARSTAASACLIDPYPMVPSTKIVLTLTEIQRQRDQSGTLQQPEQLMHTSCRKDPQLPALLSGYERHNVHSCLVGLVENDGVTG